ncbi:MAG: tetratricopeptide repeat protein [Planctomycetota bacterium]
MRRVLVCGALLLAVWGIVAGCGAPRASGPYVGDASGARDEERARSLVDEASLCMPEDPEGAERLLREALEADLFQAKAHNNLGVLLLAKDDLYGAAHEFEWARKLLPGHPEPRVNLAITLERAGQVREAEASYASALEVYPGYMPAVQGAARLAVAEGPLDDLAIQSLRRVAIEGESLEWRNWAQLVLARTPEGAHPGRL